MTRFSVSVSGRLPQASGGGGGQGGSGATGPTGPAGTSAYQSAVLAGFQGTEQEWLDSLKGTDGDTGPIGPTGADGEEGRFTYISAAVPENGEVGDSWFNSSNGQIFIFYDGFWVESASSNIGPQGDTGPTGVTGATGSTGAQGEDGQFTFISDTVPQNAEEGNSWFNSSNGQIYVYYDGFWVESASSNIGPAGPTGPEGGVEVVTAPTAPDSSGEVGQVAFDENYIYICTAPNTWVRANRINW